MPYWRLFYHVVWSTQSREPIIGSEEERVIRWSLRDTCNENKIIPHAIGVMPDHVHIAVSIPPSVLLSTAVGRLKGASAHAINHNGHWTESSAFAWQGEYGIHSFGETALQTVVAYVHNQQTHHANNTLWPGLERTTDKPPPP